MAVHGVYKAVIVQFQKRSDLELHIREDTSGIMASLKGLSSLKGDDYTRTFYNGRTFLSPNDKESSNFIFHSAQVDNYLDLVPPGGYFVGGVEFGGTVDEDTLIGTIKYKNGLIFSVYGTRIEGEPELIFKPRTDGIFGINRNCICKTLSCTHRGFCDSCQIFNSFGTVGTMCIEPQSQKNAEENN